MREQTLRILVIEDNEDDYRLILRELNRAPNGFSIVAEQASDKDQIAYE